MTPRAKHAFAASGWRRGHAKSRRGRECMEHGKERSAMLAVKVTITHYVSDDPQPGIVECDLLDAHGRCWKFIEKTAVVSASILDAKSVYPQPGVIAVEVVGHSQDAGGREIIQIDTESPWGVESIEGVTQFDVLPESLVEL
jgi:hypothetical protein